MEGGNFMDERFVVFKDFNTKDWCVYDDRKDAVICRCDTEQECIEFVKRANRNGV
jgi:hypothetical protein